MADKTMRDKVVPSALTFKNDVTAPKFQFSKIFAIVILVLGISPESGYLFLNGPNTSSGILTRSTYRRIDRISSLCFRNISSLLKNSYCHLCYNVALFIYNIQNLSLFLFFVNLIIIHVSGTSFKHFKIKLAVSKKFKSF